MCQAEGDDGKFLARRPVYDAIANKNKEKNKIEKKIAPFICVRRKQNKNKNYKNKQRYYYPGNFLDIICSVIEYRGIENNKQQKINIQIVFYKPLAGHYYLGPRVYLLIMFCTSFLFLLYEK
ncbi:MAG TPA: hypothetical protein P5294_05705 [Smithellaceae bacterium]|nr:hypothetical protein [Smithellaceae bacterium]HRS89096.1 hypothetical protein [Smithellaceae bacterium]HRV26010.1 hypothetical protein [Smithellaceae bacterium]